MGQDPKKLKPKENVRFLLDTNVLYDYYLKKGKYSKIKHIFDDLSKERAEKRLVFYLPNICIPETFCKFYQHRFVDDKITEPQFKEANANFLSDLKRARFKNWQLRDEDIKTADVLYKISVEVFKSSKDCYLIGAIDTCIFAMALRFKESFPNDLCYLLTNDGGLKEACDYLKKIDVINLHNNSSIPSFLR